jgi:hypothetical protein
VWSFVLRTQDRADGTTATESERIEESSDSGLLEAWGFLLLFFFTLLLFLLTYRLVSGINQPSQNHSYGIQTRQQ